MDFLLALIIISPALVFLWIALLRYHARTHVDTEKEEIQTWMPPTLPKIIPKEDTAPAKESVAVEPAQEIKQEPAKTVAKPKSTKKAVAKPKAEKTETKPKTAKIKRTK